MSPKIFLKSADKSYSAVGISRQQEVDLLYNEIGDSEQVRLSTK